MICPKYIQFDETMGEGYVTTKAQQVQVKYANIISTAKCLFKNEGLQGFGRGAAARIAQTVPSAAISWVSYEYVKNLLM